MGIGPIGRAVAVAMMLAPALGAAAQSNEAGESESDETSRRARTLFNEGIAFADHGDWERAVHRFRAALELRESANIRYNLAQSLVHMGRLVDALDELARVGVDPDVAEDVRQAAARLRVRIEPRLGQLAVEVRGDASGTQVMVDGRPIARPGVEVPIDPGVRIARLLRGMQVLDVEEADVLPGRSTRVVLEVPSLTPSGGAASDDTWIWVLVGSAIAVAVGAGIAIGVAVGVGEPSRGDFLPPVLEID